MGFLQEFSPQVSQTTRATSAPSRAPASPPRAASQPSGRARGFVSDFGRDVPSESFQPSYSEPSIEDAYQDVPVADEWVLAKEIAEEPSYQIPRPSSGFSGFARTSRPAPRVRSKRVSATRPSRAATAPTTTTSQRSASGLERKLDALSSQTKDASGQIRSAEYRRDSLKSEYSQKLDQLRAAKDELGDLKQRESQVEDKLSRQSKLVSRLERKLSAAMGWGQDYYSSSSSFDFEMSNLDLNYQDGKLTTDSRWRLSEFLDTKRSQQSQTSSSLSQTREAIRNCEHRVSRLQSDLERISDEQEQASRKSESTQRKKAALEQELQRLQDRHFEMAGTFY